MYREAGLEATNVSMEIVDIAYLITHIALAFPQVGVTVVSTDSSLPEVDIEVSAVQTQEFEVIGRGLNPDDMGLWVAGAEPHDTRADVCATVDDERLTSGGEDVAVDLIKVWLRALQSAYRTAASRNIAVSRGRRQCSSDGAEWKNDGLCMRLW